MRVLQEVVAARPGRRDRLTDPKVETVDLVCQAPAPLLIVNHFRSCNYVYTAPADAHPVPPAAV
jgi:hypothetical protein